MPGNLGPRSDIDVVLCGGTYQVDDLFLPTTYGQSDEFGMLGGELRIVAAVARARSGLSQRTLFSGGKSKKGAILRGGEHIPAPPAAAVYAGQFTNMFVTGKGENDGIAMPAILLDTTSPNTNANMLYSLQLANREDWRDMTVITNEYHVPRAEAIYSIIAEKLCMDGVHITFMSAEEIVKQAHPGLYDDEIEGAYISAAGQLRLASEARGLADIKAGNYTFREVQTADLKVV